jgi:hypothetical protein
VSSQHRRLYEYLVDFPDVRHGVSRLPGLLSAARVLTKGGFNCWTRLSELGNSIATETWSAMRRSLRPASLHAALALPATYRPAGRADMRLVSAPSLPGRSARSAHARHSSAVRAASTREQ